MTTHPSCHPLSWRSAKTLLGRGLHHTAVFLARITLMLTPPKSYFNSSLKPFMSGNLSAIVVQVLAIRGQPRQKGGCAYEAHNSGSHGSATPDGDGVGRCSRFWAGGEEAGGREEGREGQGREGQGREGPPEEWRGSRRRDSRWSWHRCPPLGRRPG